MIAENLIKELNFKAVRSSGAGGQHVNKVSSKIELYFDLLNAAELTSEEKELLLKNLQPKLTKEGVLLLNCDESRSQHKNKEIVIFRNLNPSVCNITGIINKSFHRHLITSSLLIMMLLILIDLIGKF